MSKTVELHRHFTFIESAQQDPEVKAWFNSSFKPIGPYYQGKAVATGLSFEEQKLLLPDLLGIEANDKDFRQAVTKHYESILTNIPDKGLVLEIGLEDNSMPLSASNLPLNLRDYLIYRHAKKHPHVAINLEEAQKLIVKRFYIVDPEVIATDQLELNQLEDKAMTYYFAHKADTIKVDQILTMLGVNIKKLSPQDKLLEFKKASKRNPELGEIEQKEKLDQFIKLSVDEDLSLKYMIQELIGAQVLEKIGQNILIKEHDNQLLGENTQDAVLFLKNPKNSRILNLLKAEYQMKLKRNDLQLEKVENVEIKPATKTKQTTN